MKKDLSKRYVLRKNGIFINSYSSFGCAYNGMESLFKRGVVLPDDSFSIYDRVLMWYVYFS